MRNFLYLSTCLSLIILFNGCTYSKNMVSPTGDVVRCYSYGWGIIGGTMAITAYQNCIKSYKELGYIELKKIGVPGFILNDGDPPNIKKVQKGRPAENAGMMAGDIIIAVNGRPPHSAKDVIAIGFCKPGETINYQVTRSGEIKSFDVVAITRGTGPPGD